MDWDEMVYFVVAQDIANGGSLYQTSWEPKGPVLFFIFVPVIKLFGNNIVALRIFTTAYLLISMFFIYLTAKKLFGSKIGIIAPLIYGSFFTGGKFGGLDSNRELFVMLPIIIATYCFVRYMKDPFYAHLKLFLCGFFSATAILTMPNAFFSVVLFPLLLIFKKIKQIQYDWSIFIKESFWYLLGGISASLIILSYFVIHKSFYDFYYAFFLVNQQSVNYHLFIETGLRRLISFFNNPLILYAPITILAVGSLLFLVLYQKYTDEQKNIKNFVIGLLLFSLVSTFFFGLNMYPHYYLQMSLIFSILICFAISLTKINTTYLAKTICAFAFILLFVNFIALPGFISSLSNYKNNEFYEISEYIANRTTPQDTIFADHPAIYFLSNRKSPTKYFFWPHLARVYQPENLTLSEFSKNKPKFIVYKEANGNDIPVLRNFTMNNYHIEKTIGGISLYQLNQ